MKELIIKLAEILAVLLIIGLIGKILLGAIALIWNCLPLIGIAVMGGLIVLIIVKRDDILDSFRDDGDMHENKKQCYKRRLSLSYKMDQLLIGKTCALPY